MEPNELRELAISAAALAVAFSIASLGGFEGIGKLSSGIILVAFLTVSLSFIFHELGHRFVARRFGCYAEYKMWKEGLVLAIVSSLFGFVFAAPGAVYIHPRADLWGNVRRVSKRNYGLISIAGPLINLLFAAAFFLLGLFYKSGALSAIFLAGIAINIWLAFFNLLPIPPLDGYKVFSWDKRIWLAFFAVCIALLYLA